MKIEAKWLAAPAILLMLAASPGAYSETDAQQEARQMKEDLTPQARYNTSRKEANAAYSEALRMCRSMTGTERDDCQQEARSNLRNDLAQARQTLSSETGVGSSGASSGTGTEKMSK